MQKSSQLIVMLAMLLASSVWIHAAVPAGYYSDLNGISDPQQLKTAVHNVIYPHTVPSNEAGYAATYSALPQSFMQTDLYPQSNRWWDMYSDIRFNSPSFAGLNREHSFPKSWWGGSTTIPPYVDLNHLYPAEAKANQAKSNYPLGKVNLGENVYFDNGVTTVGYAVAGQGGGAKYVFEPADEYKGDFARTYFYMVTCYQNLTWNTNYMYMLQQNAYPTLKPWAYEMLLEWSQNDPVSQKEIDRNEAVYRIQNNRNPFIDMPGLERYIWGDRRGEEFKTDVTPEPSGSPELFAPVDGMALDFGEVALGQTQERRLLFRGQDLQGNVSLTVARSGDGDYRSFFVPETRSISASVINTAYGYYLSISYTPTEVGVHEARLTIYDITGFGAGSITVTLRGECEPVPQLTRLTALPATDVTETSYVARWEEPAEVVDYYVVNRTHYVDGVRTTEELVAESNELLITDYKADAFNEYDSYTVQSVRLGYRSVPSNAIVVAQGGIQGVDAGQPLVVEVFGRQVRIMCAGELTGCRIHDTAGRCVMVLPVVSRGTEITLPTGVYFITADGHPSPVKILTR